MDFIETNWLLIMIVAALALLVAWYVFHAARRTRVTGQRRDVLDEGAAPAARNQALIDTPTAAGGPVPIPPATPGGLAGVGEAVQAAVEQRQIEAATDDLTRLKGVGPKLAAQLAELNIVSFRQIAAWTRSDIQRIDAQLGRFQGRIERDDWVEQARLLTAGDEADYAKRFGNIS